jgi:hypothetical protein
MVFNKTSTYRSLFQDYRLGRSLLPDTEFFNQYQDGSFRLIADFDKEDRANLAPGVTDEANGMTDRGHEMAHDRQLAS